MSATLTRALRGPWPTRSYSWAELVVPSDAVESSPLDIEVLTLAIETLTASVELLSLACSGEDKGLGSTPDRVVPPTTTGDAPSSDGAW